MKSTKSFRIKLAASALVGSAFLASLLWASDEKSLAVPDESTVEAPVFDDSHLEKHPPREILGLDLKRMTWSYDCMECHQHVEDPRFDRSEIQVEHEDIHLDHGNNRYCLNCHHPENRNVFVDYDGAEIPEHDVTLLCAKCHGPKYRDWKAGVHGRQNGYWDATKGPKEKLRCIQCHDPHKPAFPPIKPLAPPTYPKRAANANKDHGAPVEHH